MKLMIAIPTLDYIHRKFVESLTGLTKRLSEIGVDYDVAYEGCTLIYISRDNLVKKAMAGKYDQVLWLDADMVFEPDIYERLAATGKDFVSALFRGRHGLQKPCLFETLTPEKRWTQFDRKGDVVEIEGCGFGCVLVKTDILECVFLENSTCFRPTAQFGEDLAFCNRALDMGYDIWAANTVEVGHISQAIIWPRESAEVL